MLLQVLVAVVAGACPTGPAWADKVQAGSSLNAHNAAECSNNGLCDFDTGLCTCFNGYTGDACQRSTYATMFRRA